MAPLSPGPVGGARPVAQRPRPSGPGVARSGRVRRRGSRRRRPSRRGGGGSGRWQAPGATEISGGAWSRRPQQRDRAPGCPARRWRAPRTVLRPGRGHPGKGRCSQASIVDRDPATDEERRRPDPHRRAVEDAAARTRTHPRRAERPPARPVTVSGVVVPRTVQDAVGRPVAVRSAATNRAAPPGHHRVRGRCRAAGACAGRRPAWRSRCPGCPGRTRPIARTGAPVGVDARGSPTRQATEPCTDRPRLPTAKVTRVRLSETVQVPAAAAGPRSCAVTTAPPSAARRAAREPGRSGRGPAAGPGPRRASRSVAKIASDAPGRSVSMPVARPTTTTRWSALRSTSTLDDAVDLPDRRPDPVPAAALGGVGPRGVAVAVQPGELGEQRAAAPTDRPCSTSTTA